MSNRWGQAARTAYDPDVVLRYLDVLEDAGRRNELWTDGVTGRTIRRWRNPKVHAVTEHGLSAVLSCYTSTGRGEFFEWCEANDERPIIRKRTRR